MKIGTTQMDFWTSRAMGALQGCRALKVFCSCAKRNAALNMETLHDMILAQKY